MANLVILSFPLGEIYVKAKVGEVRTGVAEYRSMIETNKQAEQRRLKGR
jgi:hypothetical protein